MGRSGSLRESRKYEQQLTAHARCRAAFLEFPRCAAPVLGALALALTLAPWPALATWAIAWLVLSLPVRLAPGLCDRRNWKWLASPVTAVNAWPVRWLLVIDGVAVALLHRGPVISCVATAAAWLIIDALCAADRGSANSKRAIG